MKKLLTALRSIKPGKTSLLVVAGLLVIITITGIGMAASAREKRVQAAEQARLQHEAETAVLANMARLERLEGDIARYKAADTDAVAICQWIDGLVATKKLRVAPPLCTKY